MVEILSLKETGNQFSNKTNDIVILHEIEEILSIPIPEVKTLRSGKTGYTIKNEQIGGLSITGIEIQKALGKIFSLIYLEKLILQDTELIFIPDSIENLQNLTFLSLKQNLLENLPSTLFDLPNLKFLGVSSNKLTSLIINNCQLQNIEVLDLENNLLKIVTFNQKSAGNLKELFISNNRIESLNIDDVQNLRYLSAQFNNLANIPNISNMSVLESLELDFNRIQEIPNNLKLPLSLQNFSISYNHLRTIDFSGLKIGRIAYFFFDGNPFNENTKKRLDHFLKQKTKYKYFS